MYFLSGCVFFYVQFLSTLVALCLPLVDVARMKGAEISSIRRRWLVAVKSAIARTSQLSTNCVKWTLTSAFIRRYPFRAAWVAPQLKISHTPLLFYVSQRLRSVRITARVPRSAASLFSWIFIRCFLTSPVSWVELNLACYSWVC